MYSMPAAVSRCLLKIVNIKNLESDLKRLQKKGLELGLVLATLQQLGWILDEL